VTPREQTLAARVAELERAIKVTGSTCLAHEDPAVPMSDTEGCAFCVAGDSVSLEKKETNDAPVSKAGGEVRGVGTRANDSVVALPVRLPGADVAVQRDVEAGPQLHAGAQPGPGPCPKGGRDSRGDEYRCTLTAGHPPPCAERPVIESSRADSAWPRDKGHSCDVSVLRAQCQGCGRYWAASDGRWVSAGDGPLSRPDSAEESLEALRHEREKYFEKARVYGAIAARFRTALESIATPGSTGVTIIAKEALAWRHSGPGNGVPREALDEMEAAMSRAETAGPEASKGVAEDGSVGFDLRHKGRSLGAVTFAADGEVEIVISKALKP
jgi:hypothetical protein